MKWIKPFNKMSKMEKLIYYEGYYRGSVNKINQLKKFTDDKIADIYLSDMKIKLNKAKEEV